MSATCDKKEERKATSVRSSLRFYSAVVSVDVTCRS